MGRFVAKMKKNEKLTVKVYPFEKSSVFTLHKNYTYCKNQLGLSFPKSGQGHL